MTHLFQSPYDYSTGWAGYDSQVQPFSGADKPGIMSFSRMRRGSFAKTLKSIEPEYSDFILDGGISAAARNQWFFEIAWEVANKGKWKKKTKLVLKVVPSSFEE